ncbi:preprotein translocase subunit SecY [Anaplasmataceae bacterium AB001_6]|nr:preprotein translocase subunit SecY [Anaplasmataceae bacterium AB001_6]
MFKYRDLRNRLFFTFLVLVFYRFGSFLPLPGINSAFLSNFFTSEKIGFFSIFNTFSGGSLGRMSIFSLSVMPYIVSSILIQFFLAIFKDDVGSGNFEKRKISFYSRILTIFICIIQSIILILSIYRFIGGENLVLDSGLFFCILAIFTLTSGTMILIWLGDQINCFGIGNGISIIIFTGIVAEMPNAFGSAVDYFDSRFLGILVALFVFVIVLSFVIFFEKSVRKILIRYPRRQVGKKLYNSVDSFIPIKINLAGLIPAIFAGSFLMLPVSLVNLTKDSSIFAVISNYFYVGSSLYLIFYFFLIIFLCFFYKSFIFDPKEIAEMMKSSGAVVPGIRPGKYTSEYINDVSFYLTVIGSIYLAILCVLPEAIRSFYNFPFALGGTSILIVVSVILDLMSQIQSYLFSSKYDSVIQNVNLWDRSR